jgi:hypothetical protein
MCSRAEIRWYLRIAEAGLQRCAAVRKYVGISTWITEVYTRAGVRRYLRIAEAGLQRCAAVRKYVGISESLKLDYRDVQPCGDTLVSQNR